MNREIRFRAFDDGKMIYEKNITHLTKEDNLILKLAKFWSNIRNDSIIMQFTGLKDKGGIDIYDGDILRYPAKDNWEKINYSCFEVFFHDGDANIDYNIGYTMCRTHHHGSVCGGIIPSFKPKTVSKMIVIGNIFQNPELIEVK